MKKTISIFLFIYLIFMNMLPSDARQFYPSSQLEIREAQTHIYDTPDSDKVFSAVINTFQDNGFTITNIEDELGYIWAKKEFKGTRTDKGRMTTYSFLLAMDIVGTVFTYGAMAYEIPGTLLRMNNELQKKTVIINANANIQHYGKSTKVRLTMIEKVLENADGYSFIKSSPRKVKRIYEPMIYQAFFDEVDKSIFYEKI